SPNGVGTQITTVAASPSTDGSDVARNPWSTRSTIASSVRSSMCDTPPLRPSTTPWLTSYPRTDIPTRTASYTSGNPTYPSPTTARSPVICNSNERFEACLDRDVTADLQTRTRPRCAYDGQRSRAWRDQSADPRPED